MLIKLQNTNNLYIQIRHVMSPITLAIKLAMALRTKSVTYVISGQGYEKKANLTSHCHQIKDTRLHLTYHITLTTSSFMPKELLQNFYGTF